MTTSFPFLKIARDFGTSYQSVLMVAEGIENGTIHVGAKYNVGAMGAIRDAVEAERKRRQTSQPARCEPL